MVHHVDRTACICRVSFACFVAGALPCSPNANKNKWLNSQTLLPWSWCRSLTITVASSLILVLQYFYWRRRKLCLACVLALKWGVCLRALLWGVAFFVNQVGQKSETRAPALLSCIFFREVFLPRQWYRQLLFSVKNGTAEIEVIWKARTFLDWLRSSLVMPSSPYMGLLCGIPCMLMSGSSFLWRYTVYDDIRRKHILDSLPLFFQWISIPFKKPWWWKWFRKE